MYNHSTQIWWEILHGSSWLSGCKQVSQAQGPWFKSRSKPDFFSFFLLFLINFWCILHMYQTLQIIYDIKKLRIENEKKRKKKLAWPGFELMTIKSKGRCIDHYTKWSSDLSSQNITHVLLQHYFSKIFRSQDLRQDLSHFLKKVCHSNPLTKRVTKMVSYLLEH